MDDHIAHDDLINTLMEVAAQISYRMGWGRGVDQLKEGRSPAKGKRAGRTKAKGAAERLRSGA
jgi:hypothetical protein